MNAKRLPDGDLPAALVKLRDAIDALIEPQLSFMEGKLRQADSLYMQLWDASPAEQIAGRRELSATAVMWIDALRLRMEIDTRVEITQPMFQGVPPTVGRLREIRKRAWKPQETVYVDKLAAALEEWIEEITDLLNPDPKWTIAAACPACGKRTIHRDDSAGERVRQPALQITAEGCICMACRYTWGVERFQLLAAALTYEQREGKVGMTVAELIAKLSKVDPDTIVVTDDSACFHYVTKFDVNKVPAEISDFDSPLGPYVQQRDNKRCKGKPVDVIVLSHLGQGDEAVGL